MSFKIQTSFLRCQITTYKILLSVKYMQPLFIIINNRWILDKRTLRTRSSTRRPPFIIPWWPCWSSWLNRPTSSWLSRPGARRGGSSAWNRWRSSTGAGWKAGSARIGGCWCCWTLPPKKERRLKYPWFITLWESPTLRSFPLRQIWQYFVAIKYGRSTNPSYHAG